MQTRVGGVRAQEALGEQVDALLTGEAAGVEDLDLTGEGIRVGLGGIEAGGGVALLLLWVSGLGGSR
ncbi:MAG: hypothetical protein ACTHN3_07055 [Solirubrobacterales bacterium]